MYFYMSRNFWLRATIGAIPVAPGSSQKVEQKTTAASSGVFGASSGVLVTPNQETFTFRPRVCPDILCTFPRGRNIRMRALIEAIPVSPGSSRKVRSRHTCVFPTAVFLTRGGNLLTLVGLVLARKFLVAKNVV